MAESLDARVARIEEAILGFKEDRIEARDDRKDIIGRLDRMSQSVQSTGQAVANLSLEKCGERLTLVEGRLATLEGRTKNWPTIETEVMFWRRALGGGFHALWKIAGLAIGAGGIGAGIMKIWH